MKINLSLRIIIPAVVMVGVILSLLVGYQASKIMAHDTVKEEVIKKINSRLSYQQTVVEKHFQRGLKQDIQSIISSIASDPDLKSILIADKNGIIVSSNKLSQIGQNLQEAAPDFYNILKATGYSRQSNTITYNENNQTLTGHVSVCYDESKQSLRGGDCGAIKYKVDLNYHYKRINNDLLSQLMISEIGIIITSILLLIIIDYLVVKKIVSSIQIIDIFIKKDKSARVNVGGIGEIKYFEKSLNGFLDHLEDNDKAVSDSTERLRSVVETAVDAIITIDQYGTVESFNTAAENLFQYKKEEVIGKNIKILMDSLEQQQHDQYISNYVKTGVKKIIGTGREITARRKDGEVFPIELSISEMVLHDKKMFTGIIREISERKNLQTALVDIATKLQASNLELKKNSRIDKLTGLYNRSYFDLTLNEELRRATRYGGVVSVIMCDIDYFKQYNDTLGHQAGDECLATVGEILRNHFKRAGELAARYGGEEFIAIVPDSTPEQAVKRAEELCRAIHDRCIFHPASQISDNLTASLGIVSYQATSKDTVPPAIEKLISAADAALYKSKKNGRNRVSVGKFIGEGSPKSDKLVSNN